MGTMGKAMKVGVLALLLLPATACGKSGTGTGTGSGSGNLSGKTVQLIVGVKDDPFYITMTCGAQAEAQKEGVKFSANGSAQWDVSQQRPIIDSVAATKPAGLLISPVDTDALTPDLKQLQDGGTKVVLVDTTVSDSSIGVSRISSDNEAGGKTAADALAKQMGDKGSAIVISVKPGVSTTDARIKGFQDQIKAAHPNITLLPVQYDNDDPAKAAQIVQSTVAAHPDLAGVFADNVKTAEGVAAGVNQAGKKGAIKISAFDAGPTQVQDLKNGTVQVLIAQDPAAIGVQGVQQAVAAIQGKPVQASIGTTLVAITSDNMNDPNVSKYFYKGSC
ncbi:MAG: sugar ABC transporter substrate-binding protein [Actinobacteria bacterium 13_1_20CM_3_71_11]|nr:MAG: sugar ABC transporter substrate-binding protein [Actinobacteria bacterium 13_1_20CM_3_71_11]TML26721.1 MAG: substrate-binding domain-containing protein [Actinomycetota bacterium]